MRFAFSPTASLELGSSLVRGSRQKSAGCLAEESERAKINFFALQAPLVRGAVAVGDGGVVCALLSLPQPRWSSAAPSSEGAGKNLPVV